MAASKIQVRFSFEDDIKYRMDLILTGPPQLLNCFNDIPHFSRQYLAEICQGPGTTIKNGSLFTSDYESRYVNVSNGIRFTPDVPEKAPRTIYLLGSSTVYGSFCEDNGTISAYLQKICNLKSPGQFAVVNYGTRGAFLDLHALQIPYLPLKKNDIVILMGLPWNTYDREIIKNLDLMCREKEVEFAFFLTHLIYSLGYPSEWEKLLQSNFYQNMLSHARGQAGSSLLNDYVPPAKYVPSPLLADLTASGCRCYDLLPCLNRPHQMGEIFIDKVHTSRKGYLAMATVMYGSFIEHLTREPLNRTKTMEYSYSYFKRSVLNLTANETQLHTWLEGVKIKGFKESKAEGDGKIGAIIMNCNPFTLGHRYLIEKALEEVDNLYIFVVEEDQFDFKLNDRIAMIKKGVAHVGDRVKVISSGNYIISNRTFPEYFAKTELTTEKVDTTNDLALFGAVIAPALNITHRFIGEEPYCNVTRQYNETMKRILPPMGIAVHEIPRMEKDGQAISASLVRQLLEDQDWPILEGLVPSTTHNYLVELTAHH
ncbi:MAG: adenylyltransferase/cytidyltransferase family protein [Deltaproteobacteria bacterium]|jgi:cytidyltransferase-like protein|nr:adenylyltransferase/cytidyltransferase family protein [Deltaproteobacteria bacterium]